MKMRNNRITCGRDFDQNDIGRLINIVKSWNGMIARYYADGGKYPEALISDLEASTNAVLHDYGVNVPRANKVRASRSIRRRSITASIRVNNVNAGSLSSKINKAIKEAVSYIDSGTGYPTWTWKLGSDDDNYYVIALGFADGFEPNEDEFTDSYGSHLCMKWGILPKNSGMTEYDMDIMMPYDPETGDTFDSEVSVGSYNVSSDVAWLLDTFNEYVETQSE